MNTRSILMYIHTYCMDGCVCFDVHTYRIDGCACICIIVMRDALYG